MLTMLVPRSRMVPGAAGLNVASVPTSAWSTLNCMICPLVLGSGASPLAAPPSIPKWSLSSSAVAARTVP